jgi:hypothetical protein
MFFHLWLLFVHTCIKFPEWATEKATSEGIPADFQFTSLHSSPKQIDEKSHCIVQIMVDIWMFSYHCTDLTLDIKILHISCMVRPPANMDDRAKMLWRKVRLKEFQVA